MGNPIDTYGIAEYFVESLAKVERLGPNRRLIFVITVETGGGREQQAVVKLALSSDAALQVAEAILADGAGIRSLLENAPTARPN